MLFDGKREIQGRIPTDLAKKIQVKSFELYEQGEEDPFSKALEIVIRAGLELVDMTPARKCD